MIVSHEHKFIFLKTSKTAGTSIEIALSEFCGPDDVITPIVAEDEAMRTEKGFRGPQNYAAGFGAYFGKRMPRDVARLVIKGKPKERFYHHMPAREAAPLIDPDVWNSYYKICVVRNPFDRVISQYYWKHREGPRPPFDEFLASDQIDRLNRMSWGIYTIDDRVVCDHVCRFENLKDELAGVYKHLGLPGEVDLPRAKGGHRVDKRPYREVLEPHHVERITSVFSKELDHFGYAF